MRVCATRNCEQISKCQHLLGTYEDEQESGVAAAEPVRGKARAEAREANAAQRVVPSKPLWDRRPLTGPEGSSVRTDTQPKTLAAV